MFTISDDLAAAVRGLPEPDDYFKGAIAGLSGLPENILFFPRLRAFHGHGRAFHSRHVLVCCIEGAGAAIVNDTVFRLQPAQGCLVHPHQLHHFVDFEMQQVCWLFATFNLPEDGPLAIPGGYSFRLSPFAISCLTQMVQYWNGAPERCGRLLSTLLAALLEEWAGQKVRHKPGSRSDKLIGQIASFVHNNISTPLPVERVAGQVHISASHLRARFKAITGLGLATYIRRTRIHRACLLLLQNELTVTEISEHCGFESLYSFSRSFKNETGQSPSAYRSENRR